jgi:hypothetical protein
MNKAAIFLLSLGLLQILGDLSGLAVLKGIGAATVASPAPKVFSAVNGFETYSTHFFLEWTDTDGAAHSLQLTPERYAQLAGPYNRRNIYGAALAYGPVLSTNPHTRPMFAAVARYALCGEAPVLRELGVDPTTVAGQLRIRLEPLPGTSLGALPHLLEAPCS